MVLSLILSLDPNLGFVPDSLSCLTMFLVFFLIMSLVMSLVLEAIRPVIEGNIYTLLQGYLERWHWPQRFSRSGGLAELFDESRRKPNVEAGAFKCNAS